jgi:hypothetical protein
MGSKETNEKGSAHEQQNATLKKREKTQDSSVSD